ncbi:hypothetical protein CR513_06344, partial [Mucuna pruriens]
MKELREKLDLVGKSLDVVQKDAHTTGNKMETLSITKEEGVGGHSGHSRGSHFSKEERQDRHERHRREDRCERMIRKRFLPALYERDIHHKLQSLYQGSKSVEEYHKQMEFTLLKAQIKERKEATIARFLHGLGTLVHQVVKVEMQLKRRSSSRRSTTNSSSWRGRDKEKVRSDRSPKKGSDPFQVRKEIIVTPTPRTSGIKCFKCLGKGHTAT